MTFSIDPGAPAGATIDPATGAFNWTPGDANVGTNTMILRVKDDGSPPFFALRQLRVVVLPALRVAIARNGNNVSITFNTTSGHTYRVEFKDDLGATWAPLGSDHPANSTTLTVPDTLSTSGQRFYRILQVN